MAASIKRIGELKQQVYRDFAAGFALCEDLPDTNAPYWSMASSFSGDRPASPEAQAGALVRLLAEDGVEAWVYRFGLPDLFVHAGVLAVSDKGPVFVDPFTGLSFAEPIAAVLDQLDRGASPKAQSQAKDRKVCVVGDDEDPRGVAERLASRAERELVGGSNQRAFLLNWTAELYAECSQDLRAALDAVKSAGSTLGLAQLLLYPLAVSREGETHTEAADLPLIGTWFAGAGDSGKGDARMARAAQGAEAARVTTLSRLVSDLQRDLEAVRESRLEPSGHSSRGSARSRTSYGDTRLATLEDELQQALSRAERAEAAAQLARASAAQSEAQLLDAQSRAEAAAQRAQANYAQVSAELLEAQARAERAETAARRSQENQARLLEEANAAHEVTQEALRRAGADLNETRKSYLNVQAEVDQLRFETERLTRDRDSVRQIFNESRETARQHFHAERERAVAEAAELQRQVGEVTRDRDRLAGEIASLQERLALETERLEQRLEQLRASAEDSAREAAEGQDRLVELLAAREALEAELLATREALETELAELKTLLAASLADRAADARAFENERQQLMADRVADARRFEEERKLLLLAQARLEREVQTVRGELNHRAGEVEALAQSIIHLAYTPQDGQPLIAPGVSQMHAEAAERIKQRIAELEHAKAGAEAELHNHRTMLANSRYIRTRAALSRLLRRVRG